MDPTQDSLDLPMAKAAQRSCIVTIVFTILSLSFVGLKIITRARVQGRLGWDDALVCISFLTTIPFAVTIFGQAENGEGRAMREITFPMISRQLRWLWFSILFYSLGTGLAKLSILCQYLRVFVSRRTTIATWLTVIFVTAYTLEAIFLGIFSCVPVQKYWQRTLAGKCMDNPVYYYFNAAVNMLINLIIIAIPFPVVLRLNISNHNKYGMIIAFSFGFIGCIMSAIRLYVIARVSYSPDKSLTSPGPATWTAIELHVCIICACVPSLRPLLARVFTLRVLQSPSEATASSLAPDGTHHTTINAGTHKRALPSLSWSKGHQHGARLPSASSLSERAASKRSGGSSSKSSKSNIEVRSLGEHEDLEDGKRGVVELQELKELEEGIIRVTSTSEVYSVRAMDRESHNISVACAGRSSGESESRLTRGGQAMVEQWGYRCQVTAEKCAGGSG